MVRGHSKTMFTRFGFFWLPTPLRLHFLWYKSLQKKFFFDHLPPSSCKRSLWTPPNTEKALCSPLKIKHKISWKVFVDSGIRKTCDEFVKRQRRSTSDPDASGDSHFHQRPQKYKRPTSRDSKPWFEQYGSRPRAMLDSLRSKELQRMVEDLKVVPCQINICRR